VFVGITENLVSRVWDETKRLCIYTRLLGSTLHNRDKLAYPHCGEYLFCLPSGESRIIFLPERSSICQHPPKISAINTKKQSRARLLLAHPVLYILKIQKTCNTLWKPPFQNQPKSVSASCSTCTISESGSGNATWV